MSATSSRRRVAVVVNPRACGGRASAAWIQVRERLACAVDVCAELATREDARDEERIAALIAGAGPDVVLAAGGDGTVGAVVQALLSRPAPPALAFAPFGSGDDVARGLGLRSCRTGDAAAIEQAIETIRFGHERAIDVGRCGDRFFVGSFALGMDADILRTRNLYHHRLASSRYARGYPLYLLACALNLLRRHGGNGKVTMDGEIVTTRIYNLLFTNTPLYAGEFRFDAGDPSADGTLGIYVVTGALDYLRRYPAAWVRQLRHSAGYSLRPLPWGRRVRRVTVELDRKVETQLDGEEAEAMDRCTVEVVPGALRVLVPAAG